MVVTESKPYKAVKSQLKKNDRIEVVSCNLCVRFCKTGGVEKMQEMVRRLKNDGFNVTDTHLIGVACDLEQVEKVRFSTDTVIVLACDAGVYNIKKIAKGKKVIPALNTLGVGARKGEGNVTLVKKF